MNQDITTNSDVFQVLLPLPLKDCFDYKIPPSIAAAPGTYLRLPFGSKEIVGIAWGPGSGQVAEHKLKPANDILPLPPLSGAMRQFVDWVAQYTMNPRGAILKMVMAEKSVFVVPKRARKEIVPTQHQYHAPNIVLEDEQQRAADSLVEKLPRGYSTTLLEGVTGSGKTEVYFQAIAKILESGKQVLLLLPEIALSAQLLRRFADEFGAPATVWHSDLKSTERRQNWLDIAHGRARVIIGARSALFLPYKDLGLIIVDEEHEGAFKQEEGVLYHGRDMAVVRAHLEKIPVILVSATPSLETLANVQSGKYDHLHLSRRYSGAKLPDINTIDLRAHPLPRGRWISDTLLKALQENLTARHQSLLFLNRRGYAPLTLCRTCGHKLQCKRCSAWLVEHQKTGELCCHHCGFAMKKPRACPSCKKEDNLHPIGPGVERIEQEIKQLLPSARIAVMSSDLTENTQKVAELVQALELGEIDIIVGTQMIAKGYHFPRLTLVGVVDADLGLAGGDLRAAERTHQLLLQVAGRSGREELSGQVYLQTYQPDHPVLQAIARGDDDAFYALQMEERKLLSMPPFSRLASVIISGANQSMVQEYGARLARAIPHNITGLHILGPAPAPLSRLRGKYRERFLVKAAKNLAIQDHVRAWIGSQPHSRALKVQVDIDPYSFV